MKKCLAVTFTALCKTHLTCKMGEWKYFSIMVHFLQYLQTRDGSSEVIQNNGILQQHYLGS